MQRLSTPCHHKLLKKQRLDRLYSEAMKLIEEGSPSQKSFDIAYHALKEALKKCVIENHSQ